MSTLVDSCVILDILTRDGRWFEWSYHTLQDAAIAGDLYINPVICAEISVRFPSIDALRETLSAHLLIMEPISDEVAFLAGKCYLKYRQQGGLKTSPLPDFFIGAHAVTGGHRLLTRDTGRFGSYFPDIHLISP